MQTKRICKIIFWIILIQLIPVQKINAQYTRPSSVKPGSTADDIFKNADRIHYDATHPVRASSTVPVRSTSIPVNNSSPNTYRNVTNGSIADNNNETEELIEFHKKGALELRQAASNCVSNIKVFDQVKFIDPYSRNALNYASPKLQMVNQWSREQLQTGFLLNTKNDNKYVVAAAGYDNYGTGWRLYLVSCLTNSATFSSPVTYNYGESWSEFSDLIRVGSSFTSLSSELDAVDKAIVTIRKNIANEKQKKIELEEKIRNEQRAKDDAYNQRTVKIGKPVRGLYNIESEGVLNIGNFFQYNYLNSGIQVDKEGNKILYSILRGKRFKLEYINIDRLGNLIIPYGGENYDYVIPTDERYILVFKNGTISDGFATLSAYNTYYSDGTFFDGRINDADIKKIEGTGSLYLPDGTYSYGSYFNGKKQSGFTNITANGDVWRYEYKDGIKLENKTRKLNSKEYFGPARGYGKITNSNGDVFIGDLEIDNQNKINRRGWRGTIKFKNGNSFHGSFYGDSTSNGILKIKDGATIYGWFKQYQDDNNLFVIKSLLKDIHAPYVKISSQKDVFIGFTDENFTMVSEGRCYYNNGDIYSGTFKNDQRFGMGLLIYKNGDAYYGPFKDDKPQGRGEFVNALKKENYIGYFKNGVRDGEGIVYSADSTFKSVVYKEGSLISEAPMSQEDTRRKENERIKKLEELSNIRNEENKKKAEENKLKDLTENKKFTAFNNNNGSYIGDIYQGKKVGIGVSNFNGSFFAGTFSSDSANLGLEIDREGKVGINYVNPKARISKPDFTIIRNQKGDMQVDNNLTGYHLLAYSNGNLYVGSPFQTTYVHGVKYFTNGDMYTGEFTDTVIEIYGSYYRNDGSRYHGKFEKGREQDENADLSNPDGSSRYVVYEKGFLKRKKGSVDLNIKYGTFTYPSGDVFIGDLSEDGKPTTSNGGRIKLTNGDIALGEHIYKGAVLVGCVLHKDGRKTYGYFDINPDQNSTERLLAQKVGSGHYYIFYPNRDIYCGGISNSFLKEGKGTLYYKNGDCYIGNFNNDMKNATEGMYIYVNGDVYKGSFANDKMDGKGEYVDAFKKEKYSGVFKDGLRDGEGVIHFTDGTSKTVKYINGVLQQ